MIKRGSTFVVLIALAALTVVPPAHAAMRARRFQTPGGKVTCHLFNGTLRCDVRGGLQPEPKKECELDWVGLVLSRRNRAQPNCAGDTVGSVKRTLEYGEKWKRSGRVCVSKRSGLRCHNEAGYYFKLSDDDWKRWHQ